MYVCIYIATIFMNSEMQKTANRKTSVVRRDVD